MARPSKNPSIPTRDGVSPSCVALPATPAGHAVFALGTGNRFPVHEFPLGYEYLAASGCRGGGLARGFRCLLLLTS